MNNYIKISNKFIKYNKKRSITSILSIIISFFIVFGITTLGVTIYKGTIKEIKKQGDYNAIYQNVNDGVYDNLKDDSHIQGICAIKDSSKIEIERNIGARRYLTIRSYKDYNNDIFNFTLVKGDYPKNSNEIMIEDVGMMYLDKEYKIGDAINITNEDISKEYKIVGTFSKYDSSRDNENILSVTVGDEKKFSDWQVFVNLKDNEHIKDSANELRDEYKLSIQGYNDSLVKIYGQGKDSNSLATVIFVIVVLMLISVVIIRNNISLSIRERTNEFGILKCIGTPKDKLRKVIINENIILSLIAIPLEVIFSITILAVMDILARTKFGISDSYKLEFNVWIILGTIILTIIAVIISLFRPIMYLNKISPIEALINKNKIKEEKLKRRRGGIIFRKILGFEGEYSYINLMRNKKKIIGIILSLTISITLFVGLNGAMSSVSEVISDKRTGTDCGYYKAMIIFNFGNMENTDLDKYIDEINNSDGVIEAKEKCSEFYPTLDFKEKYKPTERYKELMSKRLGYEYNGNTNYAICGYDNEELKVIKKNIVEGDFDPDNLGEDEAVFCNYTTIENENGELEKVKVNDIKVGDEITFIDYSKYRSKIEDRKFNEDVYRQLTNENAYKKVKVVAIVNDDSVNKAISPVIISKKSYKEIIPNSLSNCYGWVNLNVDENGFSEELKSYLEGNKYCLNLSYKDTKQEASEWFKDVIKYINIFVVIIVCICALNIINTVTTSQISRKKEYSILRAIGITKRKLRKIIMLESVITSVIACITGLLLGNIVEYFIILGLKNDIVELEYSNSYRYMLIVVICTIIISLISSIFSIMKIGNISISENIKSE